MMLASENPEHVEMIQTPGVTSVCVNIIAFFVLCVKINLSDPMIFKPRRLG